MPNNSKPGTLPEFSKDKDKELYLLRHYENLNAFNADYIEQLTKRRKTAVKCEKGVNISAKVVSYISAILGSLQALLGNDQDKAKVGYAIIAVASSCSLVNLVCTSIKENAVIEAEKLNALESYVSNNADRLWQPVDATRQPANYVSVPVSGGTS
ncbi:MAG: hypothetical protein ACD_46C00486G0001 [uncultured bacterium]|nr:MAG: hypothetical protein ACD_46C00486G0001 [uncultured bacterium]